jgi:predicted outer membrane protein
MVTDHGKANEELKQVASKKGMTCPRAEQGAAGAREKLQAMNGRNSTAPT